MKIRIISSYQPTKDTKIRFERLASLILGTAAERSIPKQKNETIHKTLLKDSIPDKI
jgi:hypothetical protein